MLKVKEDIHSFLEDWLDKSIKQYISKMDGNENGQLHELMTNAIEKPLIKMVLKETQGNQTKTANILGINRNTLRKKIQEHKIEWKGKS
ncbi:MAG: helix-turn-helix domain-containing protein [Nitrospinales bacterium]